MENIGIFNGAHGAEHFGFRNLERVYWNLEAPRSTSNRWPAAKRSWPTAARSCAETGIHTGRSPKDKFVVRDATTENAVWWDNNGSITPEQFDMLLEDFLKHAEGKELFAQDLYGGADPAYRVQGARLHRICLALAVHPQPADPPGARRTRRLRARPDDRRPAVLQGRSGPPRLPRPRRSSPATSPARSC